MMRGVCCAMVVGLTVHSCFAMPDRGPVGSPIGQGDDWALVDCGFRALGPTDGIVVDGSKKSEGEKQDWCAVDLPGSRMRRAVEEKKKVHTQEMEVQTEEFYPFDEILRSRKFVPNRLQDACVSRVYITIPGFCRSVECLGYSAGFWREDGRGKRPRFVVHARDIGKKIASVHLKHVRRHDTICLYVPNNNDGIVSCAIDDVVGCFWLLGHELGGSVARHQQMCDVLYQQHHEYCGERQLRHGWRSVSRIDDWWVAIKGQVYALAGEWFSRTYSTTKGCGKGGGKSNGSGKGGEYKPCAAEIMSHIEQISWGNCNPRACEDLCASIPAMFNPRLVKCVARYEEDVAGGEEEVAAAECESDSDSYVNPDLFGDELG